MDILFIFATITVVLFVASFIMKRRFGLLGLALAAGSLLSDIWAYDAGLIASSLKIPFGPFTAAAILAIIILLPAILLLFHGYTYNSLIGRTLGAALFALLALALLVEPIGHVLMPRGLGLEVYNWLFNYRKPIIGLGLIIAVIDLFLTKPAHSSEKRRKH